MVVKFRLDGIMQKKDKIRSSNLSPIPNVKMRIFRKWVLV